MRLLLITDTYPPDINGVSRSLYTFAKGLSGRGHDVGIVTTLSEGEGEGSSLRRHVVRALPLLGYPGLRIGLSSRGQMQEVLSKEKPDVLYVATETPLGVASIRAAARLGIPVISGFHTNFQSYLEKYHLPGLEALASALLRLIHNQTFRTLTPSQDTAMMLRNWGIANVGVLGRGVDTSLFSPAQRSPSLRAEWGVDEQTPVAIYVGRVAAEKNLSLLVQAFAAFRGVHPKARCVVVGDGPKLKTLQSEFPDFTYLGAKRGLELAQCYASADYFVFPSITETFGNVVLEALASGLPTVAFDYAAPRLLLKSGENGWLVPFGDEAEFLFNTEKAAREWLKPDFGAMRSSAVNAAGDYGWKKVIDEFEQELLSAVRAGTKSENTAAPSQ